MRVTAEVFNRLLRAAEWRFRVNHPFAVFLRTQQCRKGEGVLERLDGTGKPELSLVESVFQFFEKEPPEQAGEDGHRQEESRHAGDPTFVIGRQAAAGDDAVQMRVMQEVLSPGMKHGEESDAGTRMFRVAG